MYYGEIRKISVFLFGKSALYRAMNIYGNINFNALGKISADNILFFVFFLLFYPENRIQNFMQIVSSGDKKTITNFSSAELAQGVVMLMFIYIF